MAEMRSLQQSCNNPYAPPTADLEHRPTDFTRLRRLLKALRVKYTEQGTSRMSTYPFETFTYNPPRERSVYINKEPFAINGEVGIVRYRILVEKMNEPITERKRLLTLWRGKEGNNFHLSASFSSEAKRLGIKLKSKERGRDAAYK